MKKRLILFAVSISLLAGLIYFSNPGKVLSELLKIHPVYIVVALGFWVVGMFIRTGRWNYLLKKIDIKVSFLKLMKIYIIGLFLSNLTPAKVGEPVRSALLKKIEGKSFSRSLSSIFTGRILDLITLIILSLSGLFFLSTSLRISIWWVYLAVGVYISLISFALYILFSKDRTKKVVGKLVSIFSFIPRIEKLKEKVEYFSENLQKSMKIYKNKKTITFAFLITVFIWLLNAAIPFVAFKAIGVTVPYPVVVTVMSTGILVSMLLFLPGNLGSGEIISVALYLSFVSLPISSITAARLLNRFLNFWMYALVGSLLLPLLKIKKESLDF